MTAPKMKLAPVQPTATTSKLEGFASDGGDKFEHVSFDFARTLAPGTYAYMMNQRAGYDFKPVAMPTNAVVSLDEQQEAVMREVRTFWQSEQLYRDMGIPWKRGILLHGPPGAGKTTIIRQLVAELVAANGLAVLFGHPQQFIPALGVLRKVQPEARILVIVEDVDKWQDSAENYLLDAMDGLASMDRVLFIATTNYVDKVPPRLKDRPSRIDSQLYVGYPSEVTRRAYIVSLLPLGARMAVDELVKQTGDMSIAHVKEAVIRFQVFKSLKGSDIATFKKQSAEATKNAPVPEDPTDQFDLDFG